MNKKIFSLFFIFLILFNISNVFAAKGDGWEIDPVIPDIPDLKVYELPNSENVVDNLLLKNFFIVFNQETSVCSLYTSNDNFYTIYNSNIPYYPYYVLGFNNDVDWQYYKSYTWDSNLEKWVNPGDSTSVYVSSLNSDENDVNKVSIIMYANCNIYCEDKTTIWRNSDTDVTIGDNTSRLKLSYEYNENNTECKINATLENGAFTDRIYYSNYMPGLNGELLSKRSFPRDGITVTENQSLFFQAEDKDGNILATNSISIYQIGKLNPDNFVVNIENVNAGIIVTATLKNSGYIYNDIYFKFDNIDNISVNYKDKFITDLTTNFYNIENGVPVYLLNEFENDIKKTIYFEVRNKVTGAVMVTKKYDLSIRLTANGNNTTVDGGVINEGKDDEQIMTPDNDKNLGNNNLNVDWSFGNAVDNIKSFFNTSKEFFNLILLFLNDLPAWIITPLYTLFILAIIIFVFHAVRG